MAYSGRWLAALLFVGAGLGSVQALEDASEAKKPSLKDDLKKLHIPPAWFATTPVNYDTTMPWQKARQEVRRLLAQGGDSKLEAMKITFVYRQKNDIGNGHEYPMYLFLGGEYAWALKEYEQFIASGHKNDIHALRSLATLYTYYGEHKKAIQVLTLALKNLPNNVWRIARQADVNDSLGDVYSDMGDVDQAKKHYELAADLYPRSRQPWGREDLPKRAAKSKAKAEMLDLHTPKPGTLRDGRYQGSAIGYVGDVTSIVTVKDGRIEDIKVQHRDNIVGEAPVAMPERITKAQSVKVDAVSGATVTSVAIKVGVFEALKQAGLK